ncbi:protein YgfX [Aromatoleum sp.]|uniref:protein YgfX n=1 Tax=Aromatoleum sp. TaxID=2307007 RepID=UPI002FC9ECE7
MRYPIELELVPSRQALVLVAAIHLIAATAFLLSSLPWAVRLAAAIALGVSMLVAFRGERAKDGLRMVLEDSGKLAVSCSGEAAQAFLDRGCTDFGWAIWLQWRVAATPDQAPSRAAAVMLLPDNLSPGAWRGLRIWLKHKALASGKPDASASADVG